MNPVRMRGILRNALLGGFCSSGQQSFSMSLASQLLDCCVAHVGISDILMRGCASTQGAAEVAALQGAGEGLPLHGDPAGWDDCHTCRLS